MPVRYLLDTNICIYITKYNPPAVRERFGRHMAEELAMSAITLGELRHGAEKSQAPKKASAAIEQLANAIQVMPIDDAAAQQYGKIRAKLEQAGQTIGNNDLWIAAHAKAAYSTQCSHQFHKHVAAYSMHVAGPVGARRRRS